MCARTLHRIETRTSLLTLTHEWERGTRGQKKRGINQASRVRECWLASPRARSRYTYIRARGTSVCWNRIARGERARLCGRLCATYAVCCNLYSARLQFYLLHVFVANRVRILCICKATLLARTCHFPFSKSILAPCAPPAQSTTSTLLPPGLYVFHCAPLLFSNVYTFFFSLLFYLSYFIPCVH